MDHIAYIALGSNIEPKTEHLHQAIESLNQHESIQLLQQSSVYDTAPVGYADQDNFLNMVVEVQTSLAPIDLLDACQAIEEQLKRVRTIKNGPRTIDLDVLLYDDIEMDDDRLILPHPRMHERAFVLYPLVELNANVDISGTGKGAEEWKQALSPSDQADVKKLGMLEDLKA